MEENNTPLSNTANPKGDEKPIYPFSKQGLDDMLTDFLHDQLKETGYSTGSEEEYDMLCDEQKKRMNAIFKIISTGVPSTPPTEREPDFEQERKEDEAPTVDEIVDSIYKAYGTDSGILFGIREKEIVKAIVEFTLNRLYEPPVE